MKGKVIVERVIKNSDLWAIEGLEIRPLDSSLRYDRHYPDRKDRLLYVLGREEKAIWEPCSVKLDYHLAEKNCDLDNLIKQCLDLLVDARILGDDSAVYNIEASTFKAASRFHEELKITIYEWKD